LEGHWQRQNTPLRRLSRREMRLAAIVAGAIAVSVAIGTFFVINDSPPALAPGCISIETGSTMGGGKSTPCGGTAVALCRAYADRTDAGARPFQEACRKGGYD
jgi:hypothetical protein